MSGQPPPEDVALVLYERFYDRTLRIVLSFIGDRECAVEATQEAFVRAFERFGTLRDRDKFSTWVTSIALNAARDVLRRKRRETVGIEDISGQSSPDPVEEAVLENENAHSIQEAISALPPLYKTIVILHYVAEHDITHISRALGIPEGTVKSRLHRGRMLLREIIERRDQTVEGGVY